jgi:hypothetical protein
MRICPPVVGVRSDHGDPRVEGEEHERSERCDVQQVSRWAGGDLSTADRMAAVPTGTGSPPPCSPTLPRVRRRFMPQPATRCAAALQTIPHAPLFLQPRAPRTTSGTILLPGDSTFLLLASTLHCMASVAPHTPLSLPTDEWAYIAGFFDGEGCISAPCPRKSQRYTVRMGVYQRDPRPLEWIQDRLGGTVRTSGSGLVWVTTKQLLVRDVLANLKPYLKVKGEQIPPALALMDLTPRTGPEADRLATLLSSLKHTYVSRR